MYTNCPSMESCELASVYHERRKSPVYAVTAVYSARYCGESMDTFSNFATSCFGLIFSGDETRSSGVCDILLFCVIVYATAPQGGGDLCGLPGTAERIQDYVSPVRIHPYQAVRYLLGEWAGMIQRAGGDGGYVPDVVGHVQLEQLVYLEAGRFFGAVGLSDIWARRASGIS